jgi:hypothetical protein
VHHEGHETERFDEVENVICVNVIPDAKSKMGFFF